VKLVVDRKRSSAQVARRRLSATSNTPSVASPIHVILVNGYRAFFEFSFIDQHFFTADDCQPGGVFGEKPVMVDEGRNSAGQFQHSQIEIFQIGLQIAVAMQCDRLGSVVQEIQDDRNIVRGGVPPDV
jgi:hypothetical protein